MRRFDWNRFQCLVPLLTLELDTRNYRHRNVMNAFNAMGGVGVRAGGVVGRSGREDPVGDDRRVKVRSVAVVRLKDAKISVRAGVLPVTGTGLVFSGEWCGARRSWGNGCKDTIQVEPGAWSGLSALHFDQECTDALAERHFMVGTGGFGGRLPQVGDGCDGDRRGWGRRVWGRGWSW